MSESNRQRPNKSPESDIVDSFLHHLEYERRLSPRTIEHYGRDITSVGSFLACHGITHWHTADSHIIRLYITEQHNNGKGSRSLQRTLSSLRTFYRYLIRQGLANSNPARAVRPPRAPRRLPKTLHVDQVGALLVPAGGETHLQVRARFLSYSTPQACACPSWSNLICLMSILMTALYVSSAKGIKRVFCPLALVRCRLCRNGLLCEQRWWYRRLPHCSLVALESGLARVRYSCGLKPGAGTKDCHYNYIHICCGTPSRAIFWNRAVNCALFRNCWAIAIFRRPKSILTWIFSIWQISMIKHIRGRIRRKNHPVIEAKALKQYA